MVYHIFSQMVTNVHQDLALMVGYALMILAVTLVIVNQVILAPTVI